MSRPLPGKARSRLRTVALNIGLFAIYFATARAGLKLGAVSGFATLVWPPTGIALAALLAVGPEVWPGVALGALLANRAVGASLPLALAISAGNTLESLAGAALLRRTGFQPALDRLRSVGLFITLAALGSSVISASIGVAALAAAGRLPAGSGATWFAWWFGDVMGALVVASFLLAWGTAIRTGKTPRRWLEFAALVLAVILTGVVFFTDLLGTGPLFFPRPYLAFPILILVAIQLGPLGAVTAVFVTSAIVVAATSLGHGLFVMPSLSASLIEAQLFLGVLAITELVLAAANAERIGSETQLQLIANTLPAFVTYIDREERYRFVNDAYLRWIGKSREQVLGRTAREILGDETYASARPNILKALGGEPVSHEFQWKSVDGIERTFRIDYTPDLTSEGRANGYVMHGKDVTDLRRAISARDEFMSIASHELKTPLTTLQLQAEMRRQDIEKGPLSRWIDEDERQISRLTRVIDDMLDVSRISSGKLQLAPEQLDLHGLVRDVVERMSPQLRKAGIPITVDASGAVSGFWDPFRLEQVFVNLLTNAMKYGGGKPIAVHVRSDGGVARLTIRDQGIGIAEKDRDRVFEQFERAISPKEVPGLGLGLYIARQIVAAHEGTIDLVSELGKGSTFTVRLPRDALRKQGDQAVLVGMGPA